MIHFIEGSRITEEVMNNNDKLVIIEFSADWCIPCSEQLEVLTNIERKYYPNIEAYKVDIGDNKDIQIRYNVKTTPTITFFRNGKEIERVEGLVREDSLEKIIEELI